MTTSGPADDAAELAALLRTAEADAGFGADAWYAAEGARARTDEDEARRRRRGRAVVLTVLLVFALVTAGIGGYVGLLLTASPPAAVPVTADLAVAAGAPLALALPTTGAAAVSISGAEDVTGIVGGPILGASGGDAPRPIASITKLVTALVVLEEYPLAADEPGPTLTFSESDSDLYDAYYVRGATVQPMSENSSLRERDALELMLVASATNYADAVARWAFGSPGAFRRAAGEWLASKGLTGTTIVEPTGLDPRNVSTPADLIALGRLALAEPAISSIVGSSTIDVPGVGFLGNTNTLLGTDGVTGIKTGTLDEAGACLLFSAVVDVGAATPTTVVGVILGAPGHDAADASARKLLASVVAGFHEVPLITAGEVVGTYTTPWGDSGEMIASADGSVLTWSDAAVGATVEARPLSASGEPDGATVGEVVFTAVRSADVPDAVVTVPVELDGRITDPAPWWRLLHPEVMLGSR